VPSDQRQATLQLLTEWGEIIEKAESMGDSVFAQGGGGRVQPGSRPLITTTSAAFEKCQRLLGTTGAVDPGYQRLLEHYARQGCNASRTAKAMGVSETYTRGAIEAALHGLDMLVYLKI